MGLFEPVTLAGRSVRLEPLAPGHAAGLVAAVNDGRLWELWYTGAPEPAGVDDLIDGHRARAVAGEMVPFAICRPDDTVVGVTTFLHPIREVPAVEIGATWLARGSQRTAINTEAKLLMLTHAFDVWACRRVALRTAWLNAVSRAAIERLGATFEGRIRNDRITRVGLVTDTAQYSITDADWPVVRHHLTTRLTAHRGTDQA